MIYNSVEMTAKEAEKLAYISGDVEIAQLLSQIGDSDMAYEEMPHKSGWYNRNTNDQ